MPMYECAKQQVEVYLDATHALKASRNWMLVSMQTRSLQVHAY